MKEELVAAAALHSEILGAMEESIFVFDTGSYRTLFANPAATALVGGRDPSSRQSLTCHEALQGRGDPCPEIADGCPLRRASASGEPVSARYSLTDGSGGERIADVLVTPLPGKSRQVVFSARDVTDRERLYSAAADRLRELQESAHFKGLLADILGHDLLNPATIIRYCAESLQVGERDAGRLALWEMLQRNLSWLVRIVSNVSLYSKLDRLEDLRCETADLAALLRQVVSNFEKKLRDRGVSVEIAAPGPFPAPLSSLAEEVFANLLDNAVHHGPRGGAIVVTFEDGGESWIVSMQDSGEGIPDGRKETVFRGLQGLRERVGGIGLGLSIARRIVELHGGRIWVEDAPGGGALFRVAFRKDRPGTRS